MKKYIMGILTGLAIAGGMGVLAYTINAKQIGYTPKDSTWKVDNVEEAIDSLKNNHKGSYQISNQTISCLTGESSNTCTINNFVVNEYYICLTTRRNVNEVSVSPSNSVIYNKIEGSYLNGFSSEYLLIHPTETSISFSTTSNGMAVICNKFE